MKIAFALSLLVACSRDPDNLAARQMSIVDPAAACNPWFTDVGDKHIHTATCETSGKDVVYCRVEAGQDLKPCQTIVMGPAALKAAEEAARGKAAASAQTRTPEPPAAPPPPGGQP